MRRFLPDRARVGLAGLALVLAPTLARSQEFPADSVIQAMIERRLEATAAPGIAVGLLEADGSMRTFTAGTAGAGRGPLTPRSVFEIGSITKVFTGVLLADMVRRGEVALDDPVRLYLPESVIVPSRDGAEIRLVDLATHRSGLPRMPANFRPADPENPYADYTPGRLYGFLSQHRLERAIGAEAEYSNLGVGLLGHALARRLGVSYAEAVRERILGPLDMEMTAIQLTPAMASARAAGHDASGEEVSGWDIATLEGAGALRSNVVDMLRFLEANVGPAETSLERAMRDAHVPRDSLGEMEIGLAWLTRTHGVRRTVWHNGGTGGYRAFAGFDPESGRAVVVLTNSRMGVDDIGFHLLDPSLPLSPVLPLTRYAVLIIVAAFLLGGGLYSGLAARMARRRSGAHLLTMWMGSAAVASVVLTRFVFAPYGFGFTPELTAVVLLALVVLPTGVPTVVALHRARRRPRASLTSDALWTVVSFPVGLVFGVAVLIAVF